VAQEHQVIEPHSRMNLLNSLAEVTLYAFEHGSGSERATWLQKARQACLASTKNSSACKPKAAEAMRLRGTYEWLMGRQAAAQKWWQRGLAEAERMGQRYEMGMLHAEMGMRRRERAHLDTAEALFAGIGAELDLAGVRKVLSEMIRR
jgi:hypothetical protein